MKLHLDMKGSKPNLTACGGRISCVKSTGRKQFFEVDLDWFKRVPIKDRCIKCQNYLIVNNL